MAVANLVDWSRLVGATEFDCIRHGEVAAASDSRTLDFRERYLCLCALTWRRHSEVPERHKLPKHLFLKPRAARLTSCVCCPSVADATTR